MIDDHIKVGPSVELSLPVGNCGKWGNDEKGPFYAHTIDLLQERDGLYGLSQAHLVCEDAVTSNKWRKHNKVEKKQLYKTELWLKTSRHNTSQVIKENVVRILFLLWTTWML